MDGIPMEDSISDLQEIVSTVINCFLIHVIAVIGSVGNVFTLIVLCLHQLANDSTNSVLLITLAVCDLFFLLTLTVKKMGCFIESFNPLLKNIYEAYTTIYVSGPGRLAMNFSFSQIVLIAVERYVAVFFPFQVSRWLTVNRIVFAQACIFIILSGSSIGWLFFCIRIDTAFDERYNTTVPVPGLTDFYWKNLAILDFYNDIILGLFVGNTNIAIVVISSIAIAFKLHVVAKERSTMLSQAKDNAIDIKVSKMLLAVCVLYVVSSIPTFTVRLYLHFNPEIKPHSPIFNFMYDVEDLFLAINSAANFVLYFLMSTKFQKSVTRILRCRMIKKSA